MREAKRKAARKKAAHNKAQQRRQHLNKAALWLLVGLLSLGLFIAVAAITTAQQTHIASYAQVKRHA